MKATTYTCVTYKGLTFPVRGWAVRMQIDQRVILRRLAKRWSVKRALTTPPDERELAALQGTESRTGRRIAALVECNGEALSVKSWAKKLGLCEAMIRGRLRRGLPPEQALGFDKPAFPQRRNTKTFTYNGRTQTVLEWSRELGISCSWLYKKFNSDLPEEKKFAPKFKPTHKPWRKKTALARKRRRLAQARSFARGVGAVVTDAVQAVSPPASDPESR